MDRLNAWPTQPISIAREPAQIQRKHVAIAVVIIIFDVFQFRWELYVHIGPPPTPTPEPTTYPPLAYAKINRIKRKCK